MDIRICPAPARLLRSALRVIQNLTKILKVRNVINVIFLRDQATVFFDRARGPPTRLYGLRINDHAFL